jgi:type I restriction enzyme S subunit
MSAGWLGSIPQSWKVARLKHLARLYAGGTPDRENKDYWEDGTVPWLNSGAVNQFLIETPSEYITEAGFRNSSAKWIPKGALVMALAGQGKTKAMTAQLGIEATCNQSMAAIVPERGASARFLLYWLTANYENIRNRAGGEQRDGLNLEIVGDIPCPVPSVRLQCDVANYLDCETARLDGLIAIKERLCVLLSEKRQAVISRAIACGVDKHPQFRDYIPWLGKIPALWGAQRVAWLFHERDQRGEPELPLLEVSISAGVVLREFSDERIESTAADFNTYKVARQGDIVFNKMRMWQGAVGVAPEDGLVSPDYLVAAPTGSMSSEYAGLLFRTPMFSAECARRSHGIVWDRLRLYWEGFREIMVPLPPASEQLDIVAQIALETGKLDALRSATGRTIILLKERRAALIAAAVTGQIDVGSAM